MDLPFQRAYYPYGFRLNLASNSREVLDAAQENWGAYEPQYDDRPLTVRVLVKPGSELSPPPVHCSQNHLYSMVASRRNYALIDFDGLFAYASVTERTIADHAWFRWFYLDAIAGTSLAQRHMIPMHAACVERNGIGVLLCGVSGMGKSTLAYACSRAGWTFIADDASILPQNHAGCTVTGKPHQARLRDDAPRLFPEFEGYATRARPTGKLSIEVPIASLPGIRTAVRSEAGLLVFLDRGKPTGLERMDVENALEQMMQYSRKYGAETQARHEAALRRLLRMPAYQLRYERLEDAIEVLEGLTD
jgi:HPr Serine kinase C-terminal domain